MPSGIYTHKPNQGFQKGHPNYLTKESGKKISLALKGHRSYMTEETKRKISMSNKGQKLGKKHWNWKGGISKQLHYHSLVFKKWQKQNKEYINMKKREWCRKNPLLVKTACHKRRLLTSDLTIQVVQQVYEDNIKQYGTLTCYLCLQPIPFGKDHLEHKIPLSRGGTNLYENLGIACQRCNCKKHTKTEIEYRKGEKIWN